MRHKRYLSKKLIFILIGLTGLLSCYIIWRTAHPKPQFEEPKIKLYLHEENITVDLEIEEYITGTVAAEMPASFEIEALKAQAVAARSYTLCKLSNGVQYPKGAQLSDDINSCQAYVSQEEFQKSHPYKTKELWTRVSQAVKETRGEVLIYNGEPIDALYHSTCGGRTVSALEAWGKDIPYLQSVSCEFCKDSKNYNTTQLYKYSDMEPNFQNLIGKRPVVRILETTSSGRLKKLQINQNFFSAENFRQELKLPSTWLKINAGPEGLIINSRGYGHGVGMCQYGANGMAKAGQNYQQILHKYYQQVDLYKINY
jgi:stage II sporulation protein D